MQTINYYLLQRSILKNSFIKIVHFKTLIFKILILITIASVISCATTRHGHLAKRKMKSCDCPDM